MSVVGAAAIDSMSVSAAGAFAIAGLALIASRWGKGRLTGGVEGDPMNAWYSRAATYGPLAAAVAAAAAVLLHLVGAP